MFFDIACVSKKSRFPVTKPTVFPQLTPMKKTPSEMVHNANGFPVTRVSILELS